MAWLQVGQASQCSSSLGMWLQLQPLGFFPPGFSKIAWECVTGYNNNENENKNENENDDDFIDMPVASSNRESPLLIRDT